MIYTYNNLRCGVKISDRLYIAGSARGARFLKRCIVANFLKMGVLMKYRAVLAGLMAVCLFACVSYNHLPEHVRVVEFIVPGCD